MATTGGDVKSRDMFSRRVSLEGSGAPSCYTHDATEQIVDIDAAEEGVL
jgi:hypothetical protein